MNPTPNEPPEIPRMAEEVAVPAPLPEAERVVDAAMDEAAVSPPRLRFLTPEEADSTYWPSLPLGGKFLPVRKRQFLRNPRRNLRRELSKLFGKLSGRQWNKHRKLYFRHVAARDGISRQEMKRRERAV